MQVLAEAQGATVRREVLYRRVWGYAMARGDRTVGYRLAVADTAVTAL